MSNRNFYCNHCGGEGTISGFAGDYACEHCGGSGYDQEVRQQGTSAAPAEGQEAVDGRVKWPYEITRGDVECLIRDHQRDGQKHLKGRLNSSGSYLIRVAETFQWCLEQIDKARAALATASTMSEAVRDVLAERERQVRVEGFTPERDDEYDPGILSSAALAYVSYAADMIHPFSLGDGNRDLEGGPPMSWPWDRKWWKPVNPRRALIKAGALILAEIERIDRANAEGEKS